MLEKIKNLKLKSRTANNKEFEEIDLEIEGSVIENPEAFSEAMIILAKDTYLAIDELLLKEKLKDILPVISVSYLSKNYFKKTPQWFYQRLNGNTVNGKEARFTNNELKILSEALNEIGEKLSSSSTLIF